MRKSDDRDRLYLMSDKFIVEDIIKEIENK